LRSRQVPFALEKPESDQQSSHAPLSAFFTQKKCLCTTVSAGPRISAPGDEAASATAKINLATMISPYSVCACTIHAGCMSVCFGTMKSGSGIMSVAQRCGQIVNSGIRRPPLAAFTPLTHFQRRCVELVSVLACFSNERLPETRSPERESSEVFAECRLRVPSRRHFPLRPAWKRRAQRRENPRTPCICLA